MNWAIFPEDKYAQAVIELIAQRQFPGAPGSARIVAVVGGALLEEIVERTLSERLINGGKAVRRMLRPEGALGTITSQIDLLYLLGAFDRKTQDALRGIAGVRNFFAHNLDATFNSKDDDEFTDSLKKLALHENRTNYPHHLWGGDSELVIEPVKSNQDKFVVNLQLALIALMRDRISHHPHTNTLKTEQELLAEYPDRYGAQRPA